MGSGCRPPRRPPRRTQCHRANAYAHAYACAYGYAYGRRAHSKSTTSILLECLGAAFVGFAARNLSLAACVRLVLSAQRVGRGPPSRQIASFVSTVEARGRTSRRKANSLLRRIDVAASQPRIGPQRRGSMVAFRIKRGRSSPAAPCRRAAPATAHQRRPACLGAPSALRYATLRYVTLPAVGPGDVI